MADMAVTITLPRATRAVMATDWEPRPTVPITGTGQVTPSTTSSRRSSPSTTAVIIICTSVALVAMADTAVVMVRAMDMATMDSKATLTTVTTIATSFPSTPRQEVSVDGTSKSPQQPPPASTPEQ